MSNDKFQASQVQTLIRDLELQSHKAESFWTKDYSTKLYKNASTRFGYLKQKYNKYLMKKTNFIYSLDFPRKRECNLC